MRSTLYGASVTLSMESVFWITLSSTVTIPSIANITLNGASVFGSNFFISASAKRYESSICPGSLSTKKYCHGVEIADFIGHFCRRCAFCVPWPSRYMRTFACVGCSTAGEIVRRLCSCGPSVVSFGIALDGFALLQPGADETTPDWVAICMSISVLAHYMSIITVAYTAPSWSDALWRGFRGVRRLFCWILPLSRWFVEDRR